MKKLLIIAALAFGSLMYTASANAALIDVVLSANYGEVTKASPQLDITGDATGLGHLDLVLRFKTIGVEVDTCGGSRGDCLDVLLDGSLLLDDLTVPKGGPTAFGPVPLPVLGPFTLSFVANPITSSAEAFHIADIYVGQSIPEPATLALFGFGLAGLGAMARRRKAA